jgi:hypothetical protein
MEPTLQCADIARGLELLLDIWACLKRRVLLLRHL